MNTHTFDVYRVILMGALGVPRGMLIQEKQSIKMGDIEMGIAISKRDARLLVDALFLYLHLVDITAQADKAGELCKGHRLLRITSKARERYLRIRSEFE